MHGLVVQSQLGQQQLDLQAEEQAQATLIKQAAIMRAVLKEENVFIRIVFGSALANKEDLVTSAWTTDLMEGYANCLHPPVAEPGFLVNVREAAVFGLEVTTNVAQTLRKHQELHNQVVVGPHLPLHQLLQLQDLQLLVEQPGNYTIVLNLTAVATHI